MSKTTTTSPRKLLLPLGIGTALSLLGDNTLYTVLPNADIAAQAGLTLAAVGIMLGVNRIIRVFLNGPIGILYDRMPRRRLLIASLFIGALSTGLYTVATGTLPWLLSRMLWGVAWSGIWIGGNTAVLDVATGENRGRLTGQYQMWFLFGAALSALLAGLFTDIFGFRGGLAISAGITLLAVLIWLIFLPETRPEAPQQSQHAEEARTAPDRSFPWREALAPAMPLFVSRFIFTGVISATTILWLENIIGERATLLNFVIPLATLTGILSSSRTVVSVIGAPIAGYFSDRIGRRWLVIAIGSAIGAGGMWLMGSRGLPLALGGALAAALASGITQALVPAITGDRVAPDRQSRALSVIFTLGDLGSAIAPPLALGLLPLLSISALYRMSAALFVVVLLFAAWQSTRESILSQHTQTKPASSS